MVCLYIVNDPLWLWATFSPLLLVFSRNKHNKYCLKELSSFPLNNKGPPIQSLNQKFKFQHIVGFDLKEIARLPQKLSLWAKVLLLRVWFPSLQQWAETG